MRWSRQFKADHQYQIVIGPGTVDEVYKHFIEETGAQKLRKMKRNKPLHKRNPVQRLIKLLGIFYTNITCDCDSWFVNGNQ